MPSSTRTAASRLSELRGILSNMRPGDVVREMIPPTFTMRLYNRNAPIGLHPPDNYRERTYEDLITEYNAIQLQRDEITTLTVPPRIQLTNNACDHFIDGLRYYVSQNATYRARATGRPYIDPVIYNTQGATMGAPSGEQTDPPVTDIQHDQPVDAVEASPPTCTSQGITLQEAIFLDVVAMKYGDNIRDIAITISPYQQSSQDTSREFIAIVHPALLDEVSRYAEQHVDDNDGGDEEDGPSLWLEYHYGRNRAHVTRWFPNDQFIANISSDSHWNRFLPFVASYLAGIPVNTMATQIYNNHGCEFCRGSWPEACTGDSRAATAAYATKCLQLLEEDWRSRGYESNIPYSEGIQVYQ